MSISQQALLFAIGIGLSSLAAIISYITGRRSATMHPRMISEPEMAFSRLNLFGAQLPTDLPQPPRFGVIQTLAFTALTLSFYIFGVTVAMLIGRDGLNAPVIVLALDTISAVSIGMGWSGGITVLFASLGLAKTEDGSAYMRFSARVFLVALVVALVALSVRAVVIGIIH